MAGTWTTAAPPNRQGVYANFVAAAQAAVQTGVQGVAAVVGQSNWGPVDRAYELLNQAELEATFGAGDGSLRDIALGALDGFDNGGAARVLAFRVQGAGAVAATLVLDDTAVTPADALTLTARHPGTRPNNWHVTVRTNALEAANKDLILYESGVEIESFTNVAGGTNTAFAEAINTANSAYITAAVTGAGARALANIVGAIGAAGGFGTAGGGVAGTDGAALTVGDYSTALGILQGQRFNAVAIEGLTDAPTRDAFVAWLRDLNEQGKRAFGVIGGAQGEQQNVAATRSATYDDAATYRHVSKNLVNLTTDLRRTRDDVVIPSNKLVGRMAGVIAQIGISRAVLNLKWSGHQVVTPYSPSAHEQAIAQGLVTFANDTLDRVVVEGQQTVLRAVDDSENSERPSLHKKIRNVATDHFVENTLTALLADPYIGSLGNTETGREQIASAVLGFLQTLEGSVLQPGTSTVELDDRFVQTGTAVFIKVGITYAQAIERIFLTVRVS